MDAPAPFRHLLVPLDGSGFAEAALPLAMRIARHDGASLELALVHEDDEPVLVAAGHAARDRRDRALELAYLEETAREIGYGGSGAPSTGILEGDVPEALEQEARERDVDLIVISTHGRGGLDRAWLGSVADRVVRGAGVPVLLVRPGDGAPPRSDVGNVLLPLDGSKASERILPDALRFARAMDASVTLLRVVEPVVIVGAPRVAHAVHFDRAAQQRGLDEAESYLLGVRREIEGAGARVRATEVAVDPMPATAVLRHVASRPNAAVALVTRGRSGIARAVIGSVADKILRGATVPVLAFRPTSADRH